MCKEWIQKAIEQVKKRKRNKRIRDALVQGERILEEIQHNKLLVDPKADITYAVFQEIKEEINEWKDSIRSIDASILKDVESKIDFNNVLSTSSNVLEGIANNVLGALRKCL